MAPNCNNKADVHSEEKAISNYTFESSPTTHYGARAFARNQLLFAYTDGEGDVMHLELTTKLIDALENIKYEYGHGAQAVREVMTLMQRQGAVWREIRDPKWWLENFERDIESNHPDYVRAMSDFSVFLTLFSEYEASQDDKSPGPFDTGTPHETELHKLWQALRSGTQ